MKKNLILFTNSFPFGHGEQFLETEIKFLSKVFKTITIFPMHIENKKRNIPDNIIINTDLVNNKQNILIGIVLAIRSTLFWSELLNTTPRKFSAIRRLTIDIAYGKRIDYYFDKQFKADNNLESTLLYSYWMNAATVGMSILKTRFPNLTIISRTHGGDLYKERHTSGYLPFRPFLFDKLDKIFTISEHGKKYIIDNYKIDKKIEIARLGVTDTLGSYNPSLSEKEFNIVTCSFLLPVKRLDLFAYALDLVGKKNPDLIISWNHIGDGLVLKNILDITKKFSKNIKTCFHGTLENNEIMDFYKIYSNDLFVNVSSSEGIPVSIMEAYSFGIPALATAVGGTPEIVNEKNGFLVEKDIYVNELCLQINEIIKNKSQLVEKSRHAKNTWEKTYNADINYTNFSKKLLEIK